MPNRAVFADGGEDFVGDPTTELCSLRLVGSNDDFVEARLIDDRKLLRASKGVHRADTLHVFIEAGGNIPSVGDSKSITHVFEDEEWFALIVCHDADVVTEVVEDGDGVHRLFSFVELLLG